MAVVRMRGVSIEVVVVGVVRRPRPSPRPHPAPRASRLQRQLALRRLNCVSAWMNVQLYIYYDVKIPIHQTTSLYDVLGNGCTTSL